MQLTKTTLTQIATIARQYRADEDDLGFEVLDQIREYGAEVVLHRGRLTEQTDRSLRLFAQMPTENNPFAGRCR